MATLPRTGISIPIGTDYVKRIGTGGLGVFAVIQALESAMVLLAGDDITGKFSAVGYDMPNSASPSADLTAIPNGAIYLGKVAAKTGYGGTTQNGIIIGSKNSANSYKGCGQIFIDQAGVIWWRSGATSSAWGNWGCFWHAGNDGAGSGLDADVVRGYVPVNKAGDTVTGELLTSMLLATLGIKRTDSLNGRAFLRMLNADNSVIGSLGFSRADGTGILDIINAIGAINLAPASGQQATVGGNAIWHSGNVAYVSNSYGQAMKFPNGVLLQAGTTVSGTTYFPTSFSDASKIKIVMQDFDGRVFTGGKGGRTYYSSLSTSSFAAYFTFPRYTHDTETGSWENYTAPGCDYFAWGI